MSSTAPAAYPVTYDVERQLTDRNRLTVFFRLILAIPHLILVGSVAVGLGALPFFIFAGDDGGWRQAGWGGAALSEAAGVMAVIAWFAIIFWRTHPRGLWDFVHYYMRWKARAVAYFALLRDDYPPFGDSDYPISFAVGEMPADARDRWSVGLRLIYVIPHAIVLFFLGIAWAILAFISWLIILFTGAYPEGLYNFSVGYLRWSLRVEAYLLLMRDEYPPFSFD